MAGCTGPQSAFQAAGTAAADILALFVWMTVGASVVWTIVIGLSIYAVRSQRTYDRRWTAGLVIGGGVFFPTIVLTGLLCYGLSLLPQLNAPAPAGSLTIEVSGVRWWWRVRYLADDQPPIELANEVVLPAGQPVEFVLRSEDVIHSFWIPSLGGKVDMIPGRQTRLKLHPLKAGTYRGVCAEYCGTAHAQMAFDVRVVSSEEFSQWLQHQAQPAAIADSAAAPQASAPRAANLRAAQGKVLFSQLGCAACHAVKGSSADGAIGPDLTHVSSRLTIGAGVLTNNPENLQRWIMAPQVLKPGVEMPAFDWLTAEEVDSLVNYLMLLN